MQVPLNDLRRTTAALADSRRAAFNRVLERGSFVLGPEVHGFEREFAAYCGVAHCVTVANGSDALELALRALGVEAGDEVVTVANAAMYSTLAIINCGATPVYADVEESTLTMSPSSLASVLSARTRTVVVTHLYGRLADMPALRRVTQSRDLPLVEDCAQAHGARSSAGRAGSLGDAGCFSFYPTKNLAALGDGGAITTHDRALRDRLRALRQYGWDRKYHVVIGGGRNSRLDEVQAALLRTHLPHLDFQNARRRAIAVAYAERIRHPGIQPLPAGGEESVAHLAVVRSAQRDALRVHLERNDVGTDIHYPIPDHRQPVMADQGRRISLPVTERACAEVLSLPCFPALEDAELDHVITACNTWVA
ncbi:MAG: DegT/DnrJ/EryC1/StrS family aminotransferase [Betaproteobacteria bacterium]